MIEAIFCEDDGAAAAAEEGEGGEGDEGDEEEEETRRREKASGKGADFSLPVTAFSTSWVHCRGSRPQSRSSGRYGVTRPSLKNCA